MEKSNKRKALGVFLGDMHFKLDTLELASQAFETAATTACALNVPMMLNGDTLDGKDLMRGKITNQLIRLLEAAPCKVYINTGNHDLLSEKGEESSLNFLRPYATVISYPVYVRDFDAYVIPYYSDSQTLATYLKTLPKGSRLIMHQGLLGADMGHYVQDKTSLPREEFADFRVIASHYHQRQDIKCGRPRKGAVGLFSYLGNPYSLSFGEAGHGRKGYSILFEDGILELVPLDLPRHRIIETTVDAIAKEEDDFSFVNSTDRVWVKVTGSKTELNKLDKKTIAKRLGLENFKLDKIPVADTGGEVAEKAPLTGMPLLNQLIGELSESDEEKKRLSVLAGELLK